MTNTWIPILVRSEDYTEVAEWIAAREAKRDDGVDWFDVRVTVPTQSNEPVDDDALARRMAEVAAELEKKHVPWVTELLVQFARSTGYETVDRWKTVLDLTSSSPGTLYSTQDIAAFTAMTADQWRSACRALRRHLKAHYPPDTKWPLAAVSGKNLGVYDQLYVVATAETARRWRSARELMS